MAVGDRRPLSRQECVGLEDRARAGRPWLHARIVRTPRAPGCTLVLRWHEGADGEREERVACPADWARVASLLARTEG